jgi:hypothetical protein
VFVASSVWRWNFEDSLVVGAAVLLCYVALSEVNNQEKGILPSSTQFHNVIGSKADAAALWCIDDDFLIASYG